MSTFGFLFALSHCPPEVILAIGVLALILVGALRARAEFIITELAVGILGLALLSLFSGKANAVLFGGAFIDDGFGRFAKGLCYFASIVTLLIAHHFLVREKINKFEFPVLVLLSTLGMSLLISANGLIALYLGLELMSLALYVVAAFQRDDAKASEAGLKYFVLGALSSGMLLYGASLLYGFAGTVSFAGIASAVSGTPSLGVIFGLVFLLAGLAFKISAVPFHMWTPDVYQGAPTPVTAFFASAPKVAAFAITIRVIISVFPGIEKQSQEIIIFLSILSMALGSFAAIGQQNIKRLMAYSSIGHVGFALVGLAAQSEAGVASVLFYLSVYVVMVLGTFAAILTMQVNGKPVEDINDLAGLWHNDGPAAFMITALMFSLAGIPPFAGFFAKFYVFDAAVQAHLYGLAVIGFLTSAVAAYYYLRVVKIIYFDEPAPAFDKAPASLRLVLAATGLFVLLLFAYPAPFVAATAAAAKTLF
jgi:NADH-quinone oxidoreductase subunit N